MTLGCGGRPIFLGIEEQKLQEKTIVPFKKNKLLKYSLL